jgi:3-carboxy-cis,cis-muconate cycloisomerase
MSARLIEALATTEKLADLFSDGAVIGAMVRFEVALAEAEARVGVIPKAAARAIAQAARPSTFDCAKLASDAFRAGTPAIPFVKQLTEVVRRRSATAAGYVHWGTTSQDVVDTALVLLLERAQPIIAEDLARLEAALSEISERHKNTFMLGRTLLQPAPPISFGLKAAGWLAAIRRGRQRLDDAFREALVLQFGGASGTLASLGRKGIAVARALAKELDLDLPEAPWHTQRDRLANLVCACGVVTGSLGKMAADISLMMQFEVGEVSEPGGEGRGGSSTMPHKQNPVGCALAIAAAARAPQLVAAYLSTMPQEHERAVGGWQSEWPTIVALVQATGTAASSMAEVAAGLKVDVKRMRENLESSNGIVFAERAMMLLAKKTGRSEAHEIVQSAAKKSVTDRKRFAEVLAGMPGVNRYLDSSALKRLELPEDYLGCAEEFRRAQVSRRKHSRKEK